MKYNKQQLRKDIWNFMLWFAVGYGGVKLGQWMFPSLPPEAITAFFLGAFGAFIALSVYGMILQGNTERMKAKALEQFMIDQKADTEKQAKIDKEIIAQLKHEHQLSGSEQDQRLKALEAALKHLRSK